MVVAHEQDQKPKPTIEAPPKTQEQDQHFDPTPEELDQEQDEESQEEEDDDEGDDGNLVEAQEQQKRRSKSGARSSQEDTKLDDLVRRLLLERVSLRVHGVLIKGNTKTKDSFIEAQFEPLRTAYSMQELLQAAAFASARLHRLGIFDSVCVTLVVEVIETPIWVFSLSLRPDLGPLKDLSKYKNIFGYGDIWDASEAYGWDQTSE